jgi:hypothetical protein
MRLVEKGLNRPQARAAPSSLLDHLVGAGQQHRRHVEHLQLARGVALIPYRAENFRILPVLGAAGANVSPRVGHLHVRVDDLHWYWGDFSNTNTIVVTDLPPGEHKVRIELASPEHHVHTGQTVTFIVPGPAK